MLPGQDAATSIPIQILEMGISYNNSLNTTNNKFITYSVRKCRVPIKRPLCIPDIDVRIKG